ncbi:hypothetical protein [Agromyces sp. NPDC058110]|uniref:hypothetical protein n=1 Tax=Agromyces sp. NPDC058110 TaxID=3346345 RepID=UPI0036D81A78
MNLGNVVKSFFLGAGIGVVTLLLPREPVDLGLQVLTVLVSGGIGLLVGLVTEWLTSLLPIRLARTGTYFLISGLIALVVTAAIMLGMVALARGMGADPDAAWDWWAVVLLILAIVAVANAVDYLLHRQRMSRLRRLQESLDRRE